MSKPKNPAAVALGKLGGEAGKGAAKRRNIDYSALVRKRWDKVKTEKAKSKKGPNA